MHYKNGVSAKLGDVVVGYGYNIKDDSGRPKLITGIVVGLVSGYDTCNIRVAVQAALVGSPMCGSMALCYSDSLGGQPPVFVQQVIEYGETREFLNLEDVARAGLDGTIYEIGKVSGDVTFDGPAQTETAAIAGPTVAASLPAESAYPVDPNLTPQPSYEPPMSPPETP